MSHQALLGKYCMAMGQVSQNKQPVLHSPFNSQDSRLEYSHPIEETMHVKAVQARKKKDAETVKPIP